MLHIPSRRAWSLQLYDSLFLHVTRYKTWKFLGFSLACIYMCSASIILILINRSTNFIYVAQILLLIHCSFDEHC
jgi:hypothetical protein